MKDNKLKDDLGKVTESNGGLSQDIYHLLFENMQEGFAICNVIYDTDFHPTDYSLLDVNKGFCNISGKEKSFLIGQSLSVVFDTKSDDFVEAMNRVLLSGKPIKFSTYDSFQKKHLTFSIFLLSNSIVALIFSDINEQKILEEKLEKRISNLTQPVSSKEDIKFEDIFNIEEIQEIQDAFAEATGVASLITDANGVPITKPSKFTRLCNDIIRKTEKGLQNCMYSDACLGCVNPTGPIYQPCLSGGLWDGGTSITAGDKHIANWLVGQVLDENHSKQKMMEYADEIGADPQEFKEALELVPILSKESFEKVCDALFVIAKQLSKLAVQNIHQARFITEQKKSEEIIHKQIKELEVKNAELERFTYTVSHDLKSPLITIKGFLGMINKDLASSRYDRIPNDLKRIENAAEKMQSLLEDLLELSRIGRIIHPSSRFSVTDVAKEAVELLFGNLYIKKITINVQENMPIIFADKLRIREVLQNLIENAIKFIGDRENPTIEIGFKDVNGEKCYFVKDNGIGLEKQYLSKIFGLFDKLDPSSEGTGIGLAVVKRIIELHGGKIWAESEGINHGTTFYFTLEIV